jgi:hypothetical protein
MRRVVRMTGERITLYEYGAPRSFASVAEAIAAVTVERET